MKNLNEIYYSPTRTTQKIVTEIGRALAIPTVSDYNLTIGNDNFCPAISNRSLTIIGLPTYAGRLPLTAIEKLKKLQGNNSPVVLVVVYGNRAYEDSLLELKEIATDCGFKVIAAAAFIGEHSYSSANRPIAKSRPDESDLAKCREFAQIIRSKINDLNTETTISEVVIPGNTPHKERVKQPPLSPETNIEACDKCGVCIDVCPTGAITMNEEVSTNKELCIWCCACVKYCPNDARFFDNPTVNATRERLYENFSARKEPEFFV